MASKNRGNLNVYVKQEYYMQKSVFRTFSFCPAATQGDSSQIKDAELVATPAK